MNNGTMIKTIFLKATPEKVWAYLTEADKLGEWFHPAKETLKAGSDYALMSTTKTDPESKVCWGEVLKANPFDLLIYSFTHDHLAGHETTVRWDLAPLHGGTQLMMTHSGLGESADPLGMLTDHDIGWDEHFGQLREAFA